MTEQLSLHLISPGDSFPGGAVVQNPNAREGDARDRSLIPGSRKSPGEENDNPLQYSCLENPMDRGAWRATVYGVAESNTSEHARWVTPH